MTSAVALPLTLLARLYAAGLVAAVLAACAGSSSGTAAPGDGRLHAAPDAVMAPAAPGLHRFRAGASALLYVPEGLAAGPAPFLVLLHGAGGKGDDMIRRFRAEADRRGIVLFAPDAARSTWDAVVEVGRGRPPAFGEDVARVDSALAEAFARVPADPKRMAIAGFSDGASYALSLGARNSDRFVAILAFSPGLVVPGETGPPTLVVITHGEKDRVLPIAVARDTLTPMLQQAGFRVNFIAFNGGHELPDDVLTRALDAWLGAAR